MDGSICEGHAGQATGLRALFRRDTFREYTAGSLWFAPAVWAGGALLVGVGLSHVTIGPHSVWSPWAFQGTADDARTLLISVSSTVVTVIGLVLA